jgi:hypothetical protein
MAFAIFFTGDLLRECAFSSRTSAFDQVRRLVRLARLLAISHSCERHAAAATLSIAEPAWDEKTVEILLRVIVSAANCRREERRPTSTPAEAAMGAFAKSWRREQKELMSKGDRLRHQGHSLIFKTGVIMN